MYGTIEAKCIVTLSFMLVPGKNLLLSFSQCVCVSKVRNERDVVAFDSIQASIFPIEFDDFGPAAIQMEM